MGSIRGIARRGSIVAGLVIAGLGVGAAPAAAYTPYAWGYPGGIDTPRIVGQTVDSFTSSITFPARYVSKSPQYAGYQQRACVTYNFVLANPTSTSWTQGGSATTCGWMTTNNTVLIAGYPFSVYRSWVYAGNIQVDWYLSNGAWIGRRVLDYNAVGDYSCIYCTVAYTNSLGAFLRL